MTAVSLECPGADRTHPGRDIGGPAADRAAWGLWILLLIVVTVLVALQPGRRSVTPTYVQAVRFWWAGWNIYDSSVYGFLYPPQFAVLYTPFAKAPVPLGDVLWRWLNLGLFVSGLARLARTAPHPVGREAGRFALLTLLAFPACLSSARNGQVNMTEAALMAHAAVALAAARAWPATASLALGIALKPVALVMAALAAVTRLGLAWRLLAAGLGVFLLPFAAAPPAYVWRQYAGFVEKMRLSSVPGVDAFSDLGGLLLSAGLRVPDASLLPVRAAAAVLILAAWLWASRRFAEPERSHTLFALAAVYVTVFNPRTETNGYVMLAPAVGLFALHARAAGASRAVALLALVAIGLGADNYPAHRQTDHWLKPALGLVFLAWLLARIARARSTAPATSRARPSFTVLG